MHEYHCGKEHHILVTTEALFDTAERFLPNITLLTHFWRILPKFLANWTWVLYGRIILAGQIRFLVRWAISAMKVPVRYPMSLPAGEIEWLLAGSTTAPFTTGDGFWILGKVFLTGKICKWRVFGYALHRKFLTRLISGRAFLAGKNECHGDLPICTTEFVGLFSIIMTGKKNAYNTTRFPRGPPPEY
jgi:hypothetical protein